MGERGPASGTRHTGSGHGKLILCGEHAVVHGHPAIALGIDRSTTVTLEVCDGPSRLPRAAEDDPRLASALRSVLPDNGLSVHIESDLPMGRGLGSSAALSVAVARALQSLHGVRDEAEVLTLAARMEAVFHGRPSGIDHTVAARGGILRFQRTASGAESSALVLPAWPLVVLDSGQPGDTATQVAAVTARRPGIDPLLDRIGALVDEVCAVLDDSEAVGPLLSENHRLLRQIGVSTPALDALVDLALTAGALGAKLAGAGGGGVVLALVDDPAPVLAAARAQDVPAFACRPGGGAACA